MKVEGFTKKAGRASLNIKITKELHSDIADLRHQAEELGGTFNVSSAVEGFLRNFINETQTAFAKLRADKAKADEVKSQKQEEQLDFEDGFDEFTTDSK